MSRRILRAIISTESVGPKTYATWNPADKNVNITLSGGNLIASSIVVTGQSVRSNQSFVPGKSYYCELKWNSGVNIYFGVGTSVPSLSQNPGANKFSWSLANTGLKWNNATSAAYTNSISIGGTIGLMLKWNKENNTWAIHFRTTSGLIVSTPAYTDITGPLYLMTGATNIFNATLNAGASAFVYLLPDGAFPGLWTQSANVLNQLYMATESFITNSLDSIPSTIFEGRIASNSDISINRAMSVWIWGSSSSKTSISELVLLNQDGALDYLKESIVRDKQIVFEYANTNQSEATDALIWTPFANGIMDRLEFTSDRNVKIVMGDKMQLLDKTLTTEVFPSWLQQQSEREKSKPVCLGTAYMIDPILVEPNAYYYDCHDDVIWAIDQITDQGDPDVLTSDYTLRNTGYDKVHIPAGKVAATIRSGVKRGTQLFTDEFTVWVAGAFDPNPTGWTVTGESSTDEKIYERTTGRCALKKTGAAALLSMERNVSMVASTVYVVTVPVTFFSVGVLSFKTSNGAGVYSSELFSIDSFKREGTHSFLITPTSGQTWIRLEIAASTTAEIELESITISAASHIQRLPDWLNEIIIKRAGLVSGDIDTSSFTTLDSLAPYNLGYYNNQGGKIKDLLTMTMDSFCGWIVPNRLGVIQVGRLQEPAKTPILSLTQNQIYDDILATLDRAPSLSVSIGAIKNWTRHSDSEFAISVSETTRGKLKAEFQAVKSAIGTVNAIYNHADNAPTKGTLLITENDALNEAQRMAILMSQPRNFYDFTCILDLSLALDLKPGDTVKITYPRFDLTLGKNLIVVAITLVFGSAAIKLKLWG